MILMKGRFCPNVIIIILLFTLNCPERDKRMDDVIDARIFMSIGMVSVNKMLNPKKGDLLVAGDIIEIGNEGICEIMIGNNTFLKLGKNSEIIYNISRNDNYIQLRKGSIAGFTKTESKKIYNVSTTTLIAGIREGAFFVNVENPNSTYICICGGTLNLHGRGSISGEEITAAKHSAYRFTINDKGVSGMNKNPGFLYHGEATIEDIKRKAAQKI